MSYNKTVNFDESTRVLTITIDCGKKKYAIDEDYIFEEEIGQHIPDEYRGKVTGISSPRKYVSNQDYFDHDSVGVWKFLVAEDKPQKQTKTTRTTRTVRTRRTKTNK